MFILDRAFRMILGVTILIVFGLIIPTWWCFLGLFPLVTGVTGFYPIYTILVLFGLKEDPNAYKKIKKSSSKTSAKTDVKKEEKVDKFAKFKDLIKKKSSKDIFSDKPLFN